MFNIGCESLADLREAFHFLFEELTEAQTNLKVSIIFILFIEFPLSTYSHVILVLYTGWPNEKQNRSILKYFMV